MMHEIKIDYSSEFLTLLYSKRFLISLVRSLTNLLHFHSKATMLHLIHFTFILHFLWKTSNSSIIRIKCAFYTTIILILCISRIFRYDYPAIQTQFYNEETKSFDWKTNGSFMNLFSILVFNPIIRWE